MSKFPDTTNMLNFSAKRLSLALFCVVPLAMLVVVFSINGYANTAVGLTTDEHLLANKLTSNHVWQPQRNTSANTPHKLGIQTLSIELDERKKGDSARRARVYQFNYHLKQSRLLIIDLDTAAVVNLHMINTVHLPLNETEIATARQMVEQQADIMDKLNESRLQRGKPRLNDLSTIDVKASIFEPNAQQHECAAQRCALISLFDETRTVFSVEPLVNLQALSITTLQQSL